jgi:hypothetical protein
MLWKTPVKIFRQSPFSILVMINNRKVKVTPALNTEATHSWKTLVSAYASTWNDNSKTKIDKCLSHIILSASCSSQDERNFKHTPQCTAITRSVIPPLRPGNHQLAPCLTLSWQYQINHQHYKSYYREWCTWHFAKDKNEDWGGGRG